MFPVAPTPLLESDLPAFRRIIELDQLRTERVGIEAAARPFQHRFALWMSAISNGA
jgi:hypothetical protein